ncbi:MAG: reverse transcriptase domain-containing protein [Thermodesulfobacteriota bacterium]
MYVGSTPTGSSIDKHLNLHSVFSYSEFEKAFNKLKKKNKYRQTSSNFDFKDRYEEKKNLNALGKFLKEHSSNKTELYDGLARYYPKPYKGIAIPKKNGDYRPLLVPSPLDRLVFLAALPRIYRIVSVRLLKFSALGVGIKGNSELKIPNISYKILQEIRKGRKKYVLALDFQNFFSTINRNKLREKLKRVFSKSDEEELLELLLVSLNNSIDSGKLFKSKFGHLNLDVNGIPQGLAYSPLLASFFATSLDELIRKEKDVVSYRYLDDIVIIGSNRRKLVTIYSKIKKFSEPLGLKLHKLGEKTKIFSLIQENDSFEFLGISFSKSGKRITDKAIKKFLKKIKTEILIGKGLKTGPDNIKRIFNEYVTGWKQYYSTICPEHYKEVYPALAEEIRNHMLKKKVWERIYQSDKNLFDLKR